MEPAKYPEKNPGRGAILASMGRSTIWKTVERDLRAVPHVVGVNNHMGSRVTEHPGLMLEVLSSLKSRNMFFIDSMTSPRSVGYTVAQKIRMPSFKRAIFLDNLRERSHVDKQFSKFRNMARRRKAVLAIGHLHPITLEVLRKRLPELRKNGIDIVSASALVHVRAKEKPVDGSKPSKVLVKNTVSHVRNEKR
jgi:polysaccharide deacetylase 2 family uncharacterized protein YibQ